MKKNKKNEELQSRREFFKKAAKGALPILGAIVLANTPFKSFALSSKESKTEMACGVGCMGECFTTCKGTCSGTCRGTCINTCARGCDNHCSRTCKGSAS